MLKLCVQIFASTYKNVGTNDGIFAWFFWEHRPIALGSGEAGIAAVATLGLRNRSHAASGWRVAQRLEHNEGRRHPAAGRQAIGCLDAER